MLLFVILIAFSTIPALADEAWVVVATDKPQYLPGETMEVFGYVLERKMPVIAMSIYDPDGVILSANSVELQEDDGFTKAVSLDSPFYDKPGVYLIELDYGKNAASLTFEVMGTAQQEPQPIPQIEPEVIFLDTDKYTYSDNEFITISGIVSEIGEPTILIGIYDQNDFPTGFYTPQIGSDLEFSVSFLAKDGVNFKTEGKYYAKAHYGESKQEVEFEYAGLPPAPANEDSDNSPPQIVHPAPPPQIKDKPWTQIPQIPKPQNTQQTIDAKPQAVSLPPASTENDDADNLSVEDQELGRMLNEITLSCDVSEYSDIILYYDGMGPALMRLCNYEQAISYFDDSLVKDPYNIEVLTNKATAYAKLGDLDVAIEYYDVALEADPSFVPALNNKANALAQLGHFEEAISIYESIQDQNHMVQTNLQKAKENLVQLNEAQYEPPNVAVPIVETSSQIEILEEDEPQTENLIERIGSMFASFFGFLS